MIKVKVNITPIVELLQEKLNKLKDREYLLRPVAFDLIDKMQQRIQIDGIASDGHPIGIYNRGYMRRRKKFNRGPSKKVIVSLTRQLENDYSVVATDRGYAIGFKNIYNYKKARWVEVIKDRIIFNLTSQEQQYAIDKIDRLVQDALNL